jgi:hypothetical protein
VNRIFDRLYELYENRAEADAVEMPDDDEDDEDHDFWTYLAHATDTKQWRPQITQILKDNLSTTLTVCNNFIYFF